MNTSLMSAFAEFESAVADLEATALQVRELRDKADEAKYARVEMRINTALGAVAFVRSSVSQLGVMAAHIRRGTKFTPGLKTKKTAINALRGGTVALSAVTYEGKHFVETTKNPNSPTVAPGVLLGMAAASLGGLMDLF